MYTMSAKAYHDQMLAMANRAFARHEIRERADRRWLLMRPDGPGKCSPSYWTEIVVLRGGKLLAHGDIEHVVFSHYSDDRDPLHVVAWIGCHDDPSYYVTQKALMGTGEQLVETFDNSVMMHDLHRKVTERMLELRAECDDPIGDELSGLLKKDLDTLADLAEDYVDRAREIGVTLPLLEGETSKQFLARVADQGGAGREVLIRSLGELQTRALDAWASARADADDRVRTWREAIIDFQMNEDRHNVIRLLHDARTADGSDSVFCDAEEYCDLGKVTDARVYYAHAAVRRLYILLEAESHQAKARAIENRPEYS